MSYKPHAPIDANAYVNKRFWLQGWAGVLAFFLPQQLQFLLGVKVREQRTHERSRECMSKVSGGEQASEWCEEMKCFYSYFFIILHWV